MNTFSLKSIYPFTISLLVASVVLLVSSVADGQENLSAKGKAVYDQVKAASLTGGSADVTGLVLKRDRVEMTFTGTFYFSTPVEGRVTTAVFIGTGGFHAEVPPTKFEKDNLKRMLGTDAVDSDFKTAVLRFSDDTFDVIGKTRHEGGAASDRAQKLVFDVESHILKETGANLSSRITLSILNNEKPGFFFASIDGGRRGRFSFVYDPQNRIPVAYFDLNGGERGMIFSYEDQVIGNNIWMAFYSLEDYRRNTAEYSDVNDLIDITNYRMNLNLTNPSSRLAMTCVVTSQVRYANLRAVAFQLGEGLPELDSKRLNNQLRLKSVRSGGVELSAIQEDWEGGLTVFLPRAAQVGEKLDLEFALDGDFMYDAQSVKDCFYLSSNETWYPRQGYLDRATLDLTFRHRKNRKIACVGLRISEEPDPEDKDSMITKYRIEQPVALAAFALGPFERHSQMVKWDKGGDPIAVEFNSLSGGLIAIKEDFVLAELDNSLRYFALLFGKYPYPVFGAVFHPFGFGQGFPTLLMIPNTDRANKHTYAFIAHETSHQWWGDIVTWRSYRDQWLSEGFAEYSGLLYTATRESPGAASDLLGEMRRSLKDPPMTLTGPGKGRLNDVGPIILGRRLATRKTFGAYETLIYNKGAMVLRMLHFLMSNPTDGDDKAFYALMTDFVERYRDSVASTDDFRVVANEHFAKTPIARKFNLTNLDWFFNQWVYQTGLPSYQLAYQVQDQPDGSVLLSGTVTQENVPENWFMVLPLVIHFDGNQAGRGAIHADGPKTSFSIKLPKRPTKVELDPNKWILSDKTSTKGG